MELEGLGNGGAGPGLGDGGAGPRPARRRRISSAARRRRSWPELGDGEAGRGSGRRNWPGLGGGGAGKGSETVELARGSETVSRPELRDGETGQSSCFCLFIGGFGRVNCSWIGNSGAGKGSETAGWPGAGDGGALPELGDSGAGQSSDLGDGGALLGLGATAKLAGARRWRN